MSGLQNGYNFVHLSWEDVTTLPEVDMEYFLLDNFPLNPSFFVQVEVIKKERNFVSSNTGGYLSDNVH